MLGRSWTRAELSADPLEVAPALLGSILVVDGEVALRLTEVEAYRGTSDPGSHGFRGRTPRTEVMHGPAGHLYVYLSYGMHHCVNVVCGADGVCAAVLLRAGEVVQGRDVVAERRPGATDRDLARGPGRLGRALQLSRGDDGLDLMDPTSRVDLRHPSTSGGATSAPAGSTVRRGPRVGVSGPGGDGERYPWRYWLEGEASVSAYRASTR